MKIKDALNSKNSIQELSVKGWVRTRRDSKGFSFISINDGSCLANIQAVVDEGIPGYENIQDATTGASIIVTGELIESPGKGQSWEIKATKIVVTGLSDESYPLQKKGHTPEFLRQIAHLRPRSNLFGCVFRTRSRLAYAIHNFFQEKGFVYIHTPIITASDCEGAGEMFKVTTLDGDEKAAENDFFGKPTFLTVSGQLEVEAFACSLSNVYTFGPTFRAENSNTTRHASEFWMIEPEMAYCDLIGDMDLAEEMIQYLIKDIIKNCSEDLGLFSKFVDKELLNRLNSVSQNNFERISYTDAIKILKDSKESFEHPIEWGVNLQTEHERFLTEQHVKGPVTVFDYPKSIKPFYMRANDDGKTSAAMDLLVPGIGEIIGGSQREERLDVLKERIKAMGIEEEELWWYLDLRKFGTAPHSGFGLGFERLVLFATGMGNIRDVIPFPRTPQNAAF